MQFSELIQAVRATSDALIIPSSWAQGRASFGGLVVALAYEAMCKLVPANRPLRSLAITFVGPVAPEQPVRFEAKVLREGRAVSQLICQGIQDGQVVTILQGSFGAGRESNIRVDAEPAPAYKSAAQCQELPYLPGITPEFTQQIAMRWAVGGMPFSNNPSREMGGWVRMREQNQSEALSEAHLLALVDAWPPAILPHLSKPAMGSSLTWTIEFIQPRVALDASAWCQYRAQIEQSSAGYGHIAAQLWSTTGELLAISRQTVAVFG